MNGLHDNPSCTESRRLIKRTVRRLRLADLGVTWACAVMSLWGVLLVLLLLRRLGGLGWEWFSIEMLIVTPLFALLLTVLRARRPTVFEAARKIDAFSREPDLFLTLAQLESSAGIYQTILAEQAERKAAGIRSVDVVRWNWQRWLIWLVTGTGIVVLAGLYLPQLDPFELVASRRSLIAVRRDLIASRRETELRAVELASLRESASLSSTVDRSLSELAAEIQRLHVDRNALSAQALDIRQREIETRWRELRKVEGVSRLQEQAQTDQFFGDAGEQWQQWTQELAQGQMEPLDEQFESLHESLDRLAAATDADERQLLGQQARQTVAELQRFTGTHLQSRPAESALKRAMAQLDAMQHDPGLQAESVQAAQESAELAQAELYEVAADAGELAAMERALGAIQSAKQITNHASPQNATDAELTDAERTVKEFVEQYAEPGRDPASFEQNNGAAQKRVDQSAPLASDHAAGQPGSESERSVARSSVRSGDTAEELQGESQAGGDGQSSVLPENDQVKTDFRSAHENADVQVSRQLLRLRRQGLADEGKSTQEYQDLVRTLQKNVNTAIEVEEIPPGYVRGVRTYFDSLEPSGTRAPSGSTANDQTGGTAVRAENGERRDEAGEVSEASDEAP